MDLTTHYCMYRGRQFTETWRGRDRSSGQEVVNVIRPEDASDEDFPDALGVGANDGGVWVRLPRSVLSREWLEAVFGTWKGVEFCLRHISWYGRVSLWGSTSDPDAGALGIPGDQYNGWDGVLPADEVTITRRITYEYPLDAPDSRRHTDASAVGSGTAVSLDPKEV